jgi:signal transduction histidine kinase
VLVDFGLAEALRSLALRSRITIKLLELPARRLDPALENVAYYVVAEAIANAQKYSDASLIEVRAAAGPHVLRLEIADNGVGGAVERPGSGLEGLRDRAEAVGGSLQLLSPPGAGTRIQAAIPV